MINLIDDTNKHMKKAAKETEQGKLGNQPGYGCPPPNLYSRTPTHQLPTAFTLFLKANASTRRNCDY